MGQQQVLLVALGIVIVGIAIVVGINAYTENSVKTNWDNLLQDAIRIAIDARDWKMKPEIFGGSPDSTKAQPKDYSGLNFVLLGYTADMVTDEGMCYSNVNGGYRAVIGDDDEGLFIEASNSSIGNQLVLNIHGSTESDMDLVFSVKGEDPDEFTLDGDGRCATYSD